ncbi:MAG: hypothetical protein MJE63_24165 [Proteobacteria bacterium]|nr:hypothetical protein [Pseudomonadota bacterium]
MKLKTSVLPEGRFCYGIHKPSFEVRNLRKNKTIRKLGSTEGQTGVNNQVNFPDGSVEEPQADWIFEIPNPFPFRGTTFIARRWAEQKVNQQSSICLPAPGRVSYFESLNIGNKSEKEQQDILHDSITNLPEPLQFALATTSTDFRDLIALAKISCELEFSDSADHPSGMMFREPGKSHPRPAIHNYALFEAIANNPHLPDTFKDAMVLRPGIQGSSEIVGEWNEQEDSHIFEYLRRNSYIPWGHYAANMANDAVRYDIKQLSYTDMKGLRHLYYQRTIVRLAESLSISLSEAQQTISDSKLEAIRLQILNQLGKPEEKENIAFNRTLWGWNFGFDFAPSHYRLHASHQQIHQQYAMIPKAVSGWHQGTEDKESFEEFIPFACGDLIEDYIVRYQKEHGVSFFQALIKAIRSNKRLDGREDQPQQLIVFDNDDVIVFVPKAQTSQWELQLMTTKPIGNVVEADLKTRNAIDQAMYVAVSILAELGARMITSIEFSKKLYQGPDDQHLLYSFLPKLPESPGAFSEAQLRWINGHYPEDFAEACRLKLGKVLKRM